jgi:hypothetical protein
VASSWGCPRDGMSDRWLIDNRAMAPADGPDRQI